MVTAFAVKCFEWLHNLIFGSFNLVHQTVKEAIVGIKTNLKLNFDDSNLLFFINSFLVC